MENLSLFLGHEAPFVVLSNIKELFHGRGFSHYPQVLWEFCKKIAGVLFHADLHFPWLGIVQVHSQIFMYRTPRNSQLTIYPVEPLNDVSNDVWAIV